MGNEITLGDLFQLQDRAASHNLQESNLVAKRLVFVDEATTLAVKILTSMKFLDHKQHALRVLGTDTISSIITSARVGLWGNLPESIVLLRSALETSAVLAAVVEGQEYQVVTAEMGTSKMRKYSYKEAISRLGDLGSRIDYLRGRLSDIGAHSTGTRFKFESYQLEGQTYDRLGAALDPSSAELALSFAPDVCLHLLDSFEKAYSQESSGFPGLERLTVLREKFGDAKSWNTDVTA